MSKNFIRGDNIAKMWTNMSRILKIEINIFKNISTKGPYGWWSVLMGPYVFLWPKGVSANFLIVFRCCKDANNINNIVDHFWCQNYQFWHFLINFDLTFLAKHCFFLSQKWSKYCIRQRMSSLSHGANTPLCFGTKACKNSKS